MFSVMPTDAKQNVQPMLHLGRGLGCVYRLQEMCIVRGSITHLYCVNNLGTRFSQCHSRTLSAVDDQCFIPG